MKKPRQKAARSTHLQAQDLTAVRGGTGPAYFATVGGGIVADDNGVISSRN